VASQDLNALHANMRRGEREKELENHLVKATKDKEKALKLVIALIGKVRLFSIVVENSVDLFRL
jgi:hypothetical protein